MCRPQVSTLPIRNGNFSDFMKTAFFNSSCKYLTYKEWKLFVDANWSQRFSRVSTLPIRNGNSSRGRMKYPAPPVSTLPIRNGNWRKYPSLSSAAASVSTLPIRNTPSYLGWDNKITTRSKRCSLLSPMM